MANNSPTIVAASLSDDQLKKSIDSLVTHVDEAMKKMVQSTNNAVGEMEAKLKSLGNLKIDTGGSNDGGTGRRTQQHEKLTKAVNDASEAVSKETQKLQDLQQSLSGASDREQNFISQKERAANTIAQENELLGKQQSELAALKTQQQSLVDAEQRDAQAKQQNAAAIEKQRGQVKFYEEELNSLQAKLASAQEKEKRYFDVVWQGREAIQKKLRSYTNDKYGFGYDEYEYGKTIYYKTEKDVRSLIDALSKLKETNKKSGFLDEILRPFAEGLSPSRDYGEIFKRLKDEISINIKSLQEIKKGLRGDARADVDARISAAKELLNVYKILSSAQDSLNKTYNKENVHGASNVGGIKRDIEETQKAYGIAKQKLDELTQSTQQSTQASQQKAQIDSQVAAKEKEIAETKGRIATATKEQSEAEKNATNAAKEKANIQSQVANQEKKVADAKTQLTTATQQHADAETKSSRATKEKTMTLDQQASAINTAVQSEKKYTDEVLRQAAAIRSSKEWQEKGHVVVGDVNYYDKERANVSKRDKQLLLSLEEQIVQAQQNEAQEALVAAEAKRQQAQAAKEAAQASKGVSAYDLGIDPNISAGRQRQIESTRKASKETEYLKQQVASLLEVEEREIKTANTTSSSYAQLAQYLKNLQSAYQRLGADRIAKGEGTDLANEIQRTQRAMQKLQQTMSRPVSLKDALGGSEKTLDDIAYKMQRLSSYRSGLNVDTQKKEILQVNDEYNRLKKRMDEVMQKNQQMIASNTALGRSWNYMKNRLAFYFTVGASTQFVKNLIEVRSQYEMNERALGILIDSAERGTQIFNELSQMALVSPYTLIELSAAAKQLTAYDIAAKDVVNTTRRLADMAAAVGIPIERLTYALGQVKAYGYLNARDARMFANAGIPLVKNLSEYYTELEGRLVSTADIYDRIKKKQIGYEEVMSTISKMTDEGGKFYDFQAKMAETLKVQLANLTLAWNNMLNAMGEESQGVLVGGINALKQMFLHWKDIEHVLYELVVALGAYKAYQIITTRLMGATAASLDAQVLAMKRNKAAMLEKRALTRKLTVDELRQVAAQNELTMSDYKNALSGKNLTKQKALLLIALNRNNFALKSAIINMGLLTATEANNITTGKALAIVFKSIGISIRNAALAIKAFAVSMWPLLVVGAIYELYHAWDSYGEHVKEVNKQAAEHAKEAFENIKQYLESDVTSALRDRLANGGKVENDAAGQKAWDEMREKIELSSSASNAFIAKLMQIDDINKRLAVGFDYLEDVQKVAGMMQTLEDDAIDVSSTTLGGLFGEGLKDDLQDYIKSIDILLAKYGDIAKAREDLTKQSKDGGYIGIANTLFDLASFILEVRKTTDSIYNAASKEGLNISQQREFFEREISEIAQAEQMGAKETRIFRMRAEKEYYAYARAQLVSQLEYQDGAQKALTQKRINDLDDEFGKNKALQESFFTWLTEKQDHAVKNMLRGKTQEEIKQGEWLKGSNAKWVEEMARKFSKEYGVSFDDLNRLVLNANTWSINIPVFFHTIGQPLSDVQRDYEVRTGKKFSSNPLIKDAKTQVEILDILKKKQKEVANEMETARKAGGEYWEDNKQRYKEENDALVADIHAYKALTDAEEKANKKSGKGGSKKDPLLDALKQEISLVEKLQSDYDKLSKSGASQSDALDTIRGAYGKTIRLLNTQLQSYGLPQIDISQLITGKDPNKTLAHFKQTLDTLVSKGMLTLERSKELEAVVEKFTLSAKTYNLDMITKGLNNELGKLKDEYELAVELDANPELGNMFADMFGITPDMLSEMPHTVGELVDKYQDEIDKQLKGKFNTPFDILKTDINKWVKDTNVDPNSDLVKTLTSKQNEARGLVKKTYLDIQKMADDYVKEYGDQQQQIEQIEKEKKNALLQLNSIYNTEALRQTKEYLNAKEAIENAARIKEAKATFAALKKTTDYDRFFNAIDTLTSKDALAIKAKIKQGIIQAFKDGGLTVSEFRREIKALESQFDKLTESSSLWTNYLSGGFDKLIQKAKETGQEIETIGESISIKGTIDDKDKNFLQSMGNIFSDGNGGSMDFTSLMNKFGGNMKGLGEAVSQAGQGMQQGAGGFASAIAIIDMVIKNVHQTVQAIGSVIDELDSVRNEENKLSNAYWEGFKKSDSYAASGWENLKSGNIAGAVSDTANSLISLFNVLENAKNEKINAQIKESERNVKSLENSYKNLQRAIENAYGAQQIGARKAAIANKELQLVELQRQLALENSRSSKNRDVERITDLQGQIIDLKNELKDMRNDITNSFLGISSVSDAVNTMMDDIVDALRNGEDAMKGFDESIDNMIANMIKQVFSARILGPMIEKIWQNIDNELQSRGQGLEAWLLALQTELGNVMTNTGDKGYGYHFFKDKNGGWTYTDNKWRASALEASEDFQRITYEEWKTMMEGYINQAQKALEDATTPQMDDIRRYAGDLRGVSPELEGYIGELENILREMGLIKDATSEQALSKLQQGIASVSEDTAGAIEAYLNGVSQQVYLHSDLLTQIRDAVVGIDMDVQVATQAQMLLQLQQSYAVQMAIQGILEGWNNPSGQAVRVELVS